MLKKNLNDNDINVQQQQQQQQQQQYLVFDVDGTLANSGNEGILYFPEETKQAILAAQQQGIKVIVLSTMSTLEELEKLFDNASIDRSQIHLAGQIEMKGPQREAFTNEVKWGQVNKDLESITGAKISSKKVLYLLDYFNKQYNDKESIPSVRDLQNQRWIWVDDSIEECAAVEKLGMVTVRVPLSVSLPDHPATSWPISPAYLQCLPFLLNNPNASIAMEARYARIRGKNTDDTIVFPLRKDNSGGYVPLDNAYRDLVAWNKFVNEVKNTLPSDWRQFIETATPEDVQHAMQQSSMIDFQKGGFVQMLHTTNKSFVTNQLSLSDAKIALNDALHPLDHIIQWDKFSNDLKNALPQDWKKLLETATPANMQAAMQSNSQADIHKCTLAQVLQATKTNIENGSLTLDQAKEGIKQALEAIVNDPKMKSSPWVPGFMAKNDNQNILITINNCLSESFSAQQQQSNKN